MLVTGGSRGIGREVVARFAAAGDDVLALGRDAEALDRLAAEVEGSVRTAVCDVADEAQVATVLEGMERVDVLVNNAGIALGAPLHRTSLDDWNRLMSVNATGAFLFTRAVIKDMRERGSGAIVTVASIAGKVGSSYTGAYSASKHAALGLMRVAAAELAGSGANANAVCPTYVDTDMTRESVEMIAGRTGRSEADSEAELVKMTPLGRLLTAAEVADSVVWLASPEARAINGQAIVLDGGGIQS